jgi:hypothetical protein
MCLRDPKQIWQLEFNFVEIGHSCSRAIAQVVSRRLIGSATWIRSLVKSCTIYDGQNDTGVGFLRVLLFHHILHAHL